jgi:hypothetical protein
VLLLAESVPGGSIGIATQHQAYDLYGVVALPSRAVGAKRRFCTDYLLKALQLMRFCLLHLSWPLWPGHVLVLISS